MGGFSWDRLVDVIAHASWVWISIWIGLTALTIALLVLMRTSWGASNPLNKCAALSLLAHLLLGGYATTVQIVSGSPGFGECAPMRVSLVDAATLATGGPVGPTPLDGEPGVPGGRWNQFLAGEVSVPDVAIATPSPEIDVVVTTPVLPAAPPLPIETKFSSAETPTIPVVMAPPPLPLTQPIVAASRAPAKAAEAIEPVTAAPRPVATETKLPDALGAMPLPLAPLAVQPRGENSATAAGSSPPAPLSPELTALGAIATASLPPLADVVPSALAPRSTKTDNDPPGDGGSGAAAKEPTPAGGATAVPEIYRDRLVEDKPGLIVSRGGNEDSEAAVEAALKWLAANQSPNGCWKASDFGAGRDLAADGQQRRGAGAKADTGVTSLALLAFLGAGHTHLKGEFAVTVQHGLEFLLSKQATNGNLGGDAETFSFMYCHGMSTLAISEAYALTQDSRLEKPLRSAIGYTLAAQHPSTGGWRYQPHEQGDTSQLGWQLMALKSAELSGLTIPVRTREGMIKFLKSVSSGVDSGKASYRPGERPTRTMSAEALVCRQFLGTAADRSTREATTFVLAELPSADKINVYYWYYATLAMYHQQGDAWRQWNEAMQSALISTQETRGDLSGSWTPDSVWGGYGGRVYSTAMSALCLEVYYRYLPLYGVAKGDAPPRR